MMPRGKFPAGLPDRLKFGYRHMIEMREIEGALRSRGLTGAALHFEAVCEHEARHKNDPSYREAHQKWLAGASSPRPVDPLRQALE